MSERYTTGLTADNELIAMQSIIHCNKIDKHRKISRYSANNTPIITTEITALVSLLPNFVRRVGPNQLSQCKKKTTLKCLSIYSSCTLGAYVSCQKEIKRHWQKICLLFARKKKRCACDVRPIWSAWELRPIQHTRINVPSKLDRSLLKTLPFHLLDTTGKWLVTLLWCYQLN